MADVPHFDLPFRFVGSSFATSEQDSIDDVANCVETILRTRIGFRTWVPEFGSPEYVFKRSPLGTEDIMAIVSAQEPRAELLVQESIDSYDQLIDRLHIEVTAKESVQT